IPLLRNPFNYQVQAVNGASGFGASGLPPGLAINPATGLISGVPETEGTFAVMLSATNAYATATANLTLVAQAMLGWGLDSYGQSDVPFTLTNVIAVAGGNLHTVALTADGRVRSWGYVSYTNVPANLSNVVQVTAGETHSLALKSDGTITGWGSNTYGQTNSPASLGLTNVLAIAAGSYHNLALKADGRVAAWGYNGYNQTN